MAQSPEAEAEVAAIFARLKDEVRSRPAPTGDRRKSAPPRAPLAARVQAERTWAVTAERPFEHRPGRSGRVRGHVLTPIKSFLRKLMRWYVEPMAAHQRSFNLAILTLVDELVERTESDVKRLERRIDELERRVGQ